MDNFTPDMSEKLVQYLDGELSGIEKEMLEQQLAADTTLQEALESLRITSEAVHLYGLKKKVLGIHKQMMEEGHSPVKQINSRKKLVRYAVAIAASVILLIGSYMAYNFYTITPEKVFASNFQSYELVTNRDGNAEESELIKNYRGKNFSAVIGVVYDRTYTTEELFVRGMAFAELKNSDSAIAEFNKVIAANKMAAKPVYNDEAEYYLALEYVRNKNYKEALELLNTIKDSPGHLYHDKVSDKLIRNVKTLKKR